MSDQPHDLNRRELFGAAAGAALLAQQPAAGAQVEDRGSNLRITGVRGLPCGTKAFVKIETNRNITGWGEITGLEPRVAAALADSLRELLVDQNPTRIEHLWQKVFRSHRDMRGGAFMTHTLSAIDMALWDITGKAWGVPVYRLLGGPLRDKVRMYPAPKATKLGTGGPHNF
jgi:galactonate dehydratase